MNLKTTPSNVSVRLENMGIIMRIKDEGIACVG